MPHALFIQLDRERAPWLPADCTDALHAQVFNWLGHGDAALAEHLHDRGESRGPVTQSEHTPVVADTRFPAFTVAPANAYMPGSRFDRRRQRQRHRACPHAVR